MPDVILKEAATLDVTVEPTSPRIVATFWALGSDSLADVLVACRRQDAPPAGTVRIPTVVRGLPLVGFDPQFNGGLLWTVTARYGVPERGAVQAPGVGGTPPGLPPPPPGVSPPPPPTEPAATAALGREYRFTTVGGTANQKVSISTRASQKAAAYAGAVPDFGKTMNVDRDGPQGAEVVSRKLELSITRQFEWLTRDYLVDLYRATGTVNDRPFLGFAGDAAGLSEVLFVGAEGQGRDDGAWTVTFHFLISPNRTEKVIPTAAAAVAIGGHDFVWVSFGTATSNGVTVETPLFGYVESVYVAWDFTTLGVFA